MSEQLSGEYGVDAVHRAIELLMLVADQPGLGVSEIARRSGIGKARAYRLLRTLEAAGMLSRRGDDPGFNLGYSALILGSAASSQLDLVRAALPVLRSLGRSLNETVQLRIREGDEAVCVAKWEPPRDLRVHALVGRRRTLGPGSNKVLLAYATPEDRSAVLDRLYEKGLLAIPRPEMERRLNEARQNGAYVSYGEVSEHLISVSAPVFQQAGSVTAALNVAAPSMRMTPDDISRSVGEVTAAAAKLSEVLGFNGGVHKG